MASSVKKRSSDLIPLVGTQLRANLSPGAHVVLGLSGGVDSVTLLDILLRVAPTQEMSLRAVHVHHGISPNADAWAEFCTRLCASRGVGLSVERADLGPWRSLGLEGGARAARYELLGRHAADALLLAHHRDDQSETLLIQLLRGAGVAGLAAMPIARKGTIKTIRPLLSVPRHEIEAYARSAGLEWVEDESNEDIARPRNFLRKRVMPLLEETYPGAGARLARSADHLGEAAELLSALADIDWSNCAEGEALSLARLRELDAPRARNLLRHWSRRRNYPVPSSAALSELWRQINSARGDAMPQLRLAEGVYHRYRGCLYLDRTRIVPSADFQLSWSGENTVVIPELGGVLRFKPEEGRGLSAAKLQSGKVTVRSRRGGERLQPHPARPCRTLKNLLQERGIPAWKREFIPLVYCGDALVSVPGVGDDCVWRAEKGERGLIVSWDPFD